MRPSCSTVFHTIHRGVARDSTSWQYQFSTAADGSRLSLRSDLLVSPRFPIPLVVRLLLSRHADIWPHMANTLERIRSIAEASASPARPVRTPDPRRLI